MPLALLVAVWLAATGQPLGIEGLAGAHDLVPPAIAAAGRIKHLSRGRNAPQSQHNGLPGLAGEAPADAQGLQCAAMVQPDRGVDG